MPRRLYRSIEEPIRTGLTWEELWLDQDNGLIWCWERGRQYRTETTAQPVWKNGRYSLPETPAERAVRAVNGELVMDGWRGGVEKKLKDPRKKKSGTLQYLATWQGMRGEDLDIDLDEERTIVCTRFQQAVTFSGAILSDEDEFGEENAEASGEVVEGAGEPAESL